MAPSGQTWVVTGASRGLGLEHVKQFLQQGFHVIAAARSPTKSEALRKLQEQHPDHMFLVSLDTTDDASVQAGFHKHVHVHAQHAAAAQVAPYCRLLQMKLQSTFQMALVGCCMFVYALHKHDFSAYYGQ